MPQRITEDKDLTIYFRVSDVYRNAKIRVTDGDRILFERKKPRAAPGEMESIKLTKAMLKDVIELKFGLEAE